MDFSDPEDNEHAALELDEAGDEAGSDAGGSKVDLVDTTCKKLVELPFTFRPDLCGHLSLRSRLATSNRGSLFSIAFRLPTSQP